MTSFAPIVKEALSAMVHNATFQRVITDLEKKGWKHESLAPGVIRMRHPQVDTATGYTDVLTAREIQKILES